MPMLLGMKDGSYDADYTLESHDDVRILRKTHKKTWYVLSDDLDDDHDTITATPGLPSLFDFDVNAWAINAQAKETGRVVHPITGVAAALWEVSVDFDSNVDPNDDEDDPILKPPTVRWYGEVEEEVLEKDAISDDPVQTAAEEPIILTTPMVLPVLEIKRYEAYPFDPSIMLGYSHKTNAAVFWGAPVGSALMLPMEVDEEALEGQRYAVVTYRIKFKIKPGLDEPWKARVLHHGFKHREKKGEPPVIYQDKHGNPATINLDDDGVKLKDGADPIYLEFNRFRKANFNVLDLGPF